MDSRLSGASDDITIVSSMPEDDLDRVREQLHNLITSMVRTWPGSRGFGMTQLALDVRPPGAIGIFAVDLQTAMDKYLPGLSLKSIDVQSNVDGTQSYRITVEWV